MLTNARLPLHPDAKAQLKGAVIETNAKIGAHCTLLPGVRIGAGALVGAGSVVTRDIPAGMVAFGQPATARRPVDY